MSERFVKMSDATGDVLPKASKDVSITLRAADWVDPVSPATYYTQTVKNLKLVTATINGVMGLSTTATDAQYEAAAEAQIRVTGQGAGSITVSAKAKPMSGDTVIDIPCTLILLG